MRQKSALIRRDLYQTGGGPSTAVPLDDTEAMLKEMITLSAEGTTNNMDNDASTLGKQAIYIAYLKSNRTYNYLLINALFMGLLYRNSKNYA